MVGVRIGTEVDVTVGAFVNVAPIQNTTSLIPEQSFDCRLQSEFDGVRYVANFEYPLSKFKPTLLIRHDSVGKA